MVIKQRFTDLPYAFLRTGLLVYIGLELLVSLCITYLPEVAGMEQGIVIILRLLELMAFSALIHHYKLKVSLGLQCPSLDAIKIFVAVSMVCVALFLIIYSLYPSSFAYVTLPVWLSGVSGLLLMVVLAPLVEELIFRGLLYRMLRERWGIGLSVVVSAVFFSLVHHGLLFSPQLVGGIIFAVAYEWSKSLWVSIVLHMGANSAVYLLSVLDFAK